MIDALYYGGVIGLFIAGVMGPPMIFTEIVRWFQKKRIVGTFK